MGPWALLAQSSGLCRAAVCGTLVLAAAPAAANEDPCRFAEVARGVAAAAVDARSFRLMDGREVKLAGLAFQPADTLHNRDMMRALDAAVRGRPVILRSPSAEPDRYGRVTAFAFVNASETPVQYDLLERGLAHADGMPGLGKACRTALLAREQAARAARLGLWADPRYAIRAPGDAELKARPGSFAVVQGEVVSVRQTAATTYINFGRRWSETLSVAIPRRHLPAFAEEGITLETLEGRTLRVRGYVEARTGPVIEATGPAQIEIVQD